MAEMKNADAYRSGSNRSYFLRSMNHPFNSRNSRSNPRRPIADTIRNGFDVKNGIDYTAIEHTTFDVQKVHPTKLLVRNVKNLSRQEIHRFFSKFGSVAAVEKWVKSNTALVRFDSAAVASAVLAAPLKDLSYGGRQLAVERRLLPKLPPAPSVVDYTSTCDPAVTSIHYLPDEILGYIFTFLTPKERIGIERVCKYWLSLGKDVPWRSPVRLTLDSECNPEYDPLTDKLITSIVSRCGLTLKQLTLARACSVKFVVLQKSVESICCYCPNLVELKLVSIPVSNLDMKTLAMKCKKLKSLTAHHTEFSEEALSKFLEQSELLECLDISDNYKVSGLCFESLRQNMKILRVSDCFMLDNGVAKILSSHCEHLQELKLPHCNRVEADVLVQVIQRYRKTLKVLHLDGYIRDMDWCSCLRASCSLEDLSLDECSKVDDKLLGVLVKSCPKLRALNVGATNVTDEGLYSLASAPCLKLLDISYTDQILGEGVEALAAQGKLEEVFIRSNLEVSDEMCHAFAEFCSNLRLLDVSDAPEITNTLVSSFRASIEQGVLRGPVKLVVGGTAVTEDAQTCERLELVFDNTSRRELCSDIDDYTDDDSDFDYYSYNSGYDSYYDYDSDALDNPFDEPFLFIW